MMISDGRRMTKAYGQEKKTHQRVEARIVDFG